MSERTIYFDCFAGICGSMILGALLDAGLELEELKAALGDLVAGEYELTAEKIKQHSIAGTLVRVNAKTGKAHRHLKDINRLIDESNLPETVREKSKKIFYRLALAEAAIHNTTPEKIHFHEVGATDAIIDIVGSVVGLEKLGITRVLSSRINVGQGMVRCEHGMMPVPAPATAELLKATPIYSGDINFELTTPTGAAIITELAESFGPLENFKTEKIGYGAGEHELPIPNLLRVMIGESAATVDGVESDRVALIESNIDDMNPQLFDALFDELYSVGVLEAFLTPTIMKKSRPGFILSVILNEEQLPAALKVIFLNSSTIGVRTREVSRHKLPRRMVSVDTAYGAVSVKVSSFGSEVCTCSPEYDECRRLAAEKGVSVKAVYEAAQLAARKNFVET